MRFYKLLLGRKHTLLCNS